MAAVGHLGAQSSSCHVRALLLPLQEQMQRGDVSRAIFVLRQSQSLEQVSCHFDENKANQQFCKSSGDLARVIGEMVNSCKFQPIINLMKISVDPVAQSVLQKS